MRDHRHGDDCGAYRHCERCGYPAMVHPASLDACQMLTADALAWDERQRELERLAVGE